MASVAEAALEESFLLGLVASGWDAAQVDAAWGIAGPLRPLLAFLVPGSSVRPRTSGLHTPYIKYPPTHPRPEPNQ